MQPLFEKRSFDYVETKKDKEYYEFCLGEKEVSDYPDYLCVEENE